MRGIDIIVGSWESFLPRPGQGHSFFLVDVAAAWEAREYAVRTRRAALGMDFGKIDYLVAEGEAAVIDANRTPISRAPDAAARRAMGERVADGIGALVARRTLASPAGAPGAAGV